MGSRLVFPSFPALSQRAMAWALVAALAPTLLYVGHWTIRVDIPGGYYLGLPGENGSAGTDEHEAHHRHCHGDSASCSDAPSTAGASMANLAERTAVPVVAVLTAMLLAASWRPVRSLGWVPEIPPPRQPAVALSL